MPGEFDFIRWIRQQQAPSATVQTPAGDDLAVLNWQGSDLLLVGADQVLDGVHFDSAVHTPRQIGRKVMNRNLSDCAAMACLPVAAVVSVALPRGYGIEASQELYAGIKEAGELFHCAIVGGDTGSWEGKLAVSVTILGKSAGVGPVLRGGAKPGDSIYVTGPLGGSILGRHMTFQPRVMQGLVAAKQMKASAMIDLSDGLSRDLAHICEASKVGAVIETSSVPIHDDAMELFRRDRKPPLEHALHDGEDYELLFTSAQPAPEGMETIFTRIGTIEAERGVWTEHQGTRRKLEPGAWEHTI